ncbi:MAG: RloB domain-containing protein [Verrucomicrobia bacterium]|nr:RloB domain-containing protein [Verrucomicrobiota bacterium]MCH8510745.1 RloB family protein [Kiritimatiellia bacterium]
MARRKSSYFKAERSFRRDRGDGKPAKLILIVTEGVNTEPIYLKQLAKRWGVHPRVITLKPGGDGIPANLVTLALNEQLEQRKRGRISAVDPMKFDETWIVFDTEHAERQHRLEDGMALAEQHNVNIAHSTPCFEFWLALHFALKAPPMDTCEEAIRLLKQVSGKAYAKDSKHSEVFCRDIIDRVGEAVRNARNLEARQSEEPFPANPSTTVHKLIESLYETLPEQMKKRVNFP